jgi:[ribosomal protein S5]-alanine N-acetyltransferase
LKVNSITMDLAKGSDKEYIIKDSSGITLGRVFILELSKENRYCSLRIKIYKKTERSYEYLKDALKLLLNSLFKNMNMYKISILGDEDIITSAFIDMGFQLEGIISNSILSGKTYKNELLFGIDLDVFESHNKTRNIGLKGRRVELKVLTPEDSLDTLEYYKRNKKHLGPFEPSRDESFYTLEVQKNILIESYKQYINGSSVNFGMYHENKFIGKVQISNIVSGIFKSAFVGYSIDVEYQGQGYMKEALNLVLEYAFVDMELHRIEASTLTDNLRSQGVLNGCGFKKLGINEKYLYINGEWRDHITFYKTRAQE